MTLISGLSNSVPDEVVQAVAAALRVDPGQLATSGENDLTVVLQTGDELRETRRSIQRDGIHFYNYYTMAAPPGRVAPVILDILCPADRRPALNNGHLEPAITVNLGPGDINGRWGEQLDADTWQVLAANDGPDAWITGDTYVEPSYCPHSYSLAGDRPARIVSYTGQSNLAPVVDEANTWSEPAFAAYVQLLDGGLPTGDLLDLLLARRGFDRTSAAAAADVAPQDLAAAVTDPTGGLAVLHAVAAHTGIDHRLLLPPAPRHDAVGKTCLSIAEARRSRRRFG